MRIRSVLVRAGLALLWLSACGKGKSEGDLPAVAPVSSSVQARPSASSPLVPADSAMPGPVVPEGKPTLTVSEHELALTLVLGNPAKPEALQDMMRVFAVGGVMVVTPFFWYLEGGALLAVKDFAYDFKGNDYRNEPTDVNWIIPVSVMGRFPGDLWVDAKTNTGWVAPRAGYPIDARFQYQRLYGHFGRIKDFPIAAAPWGAHRTLAYIQPGVFKLAIPAKGKLAELPKQAAGQKAEVRLRGMAMATLKEGDVFLAGVDRDSGDKLAVERWDKDGGDGQALVNSRIVPLPAPAGEPQRVWIFAAEPTAYVLANYDERAFLAELSKDGSREIALPVDRIEEAHMAADGTLFIHGRGSLYRYDGRSVFSKAKAPGPIHLKRPLGLFGQSRDTVYIAVEYREAGILLSTRPDILQTPEDVGWTPPSELPPEEVPAPSAQASAGAAPKSSADALETHQKLLSVFAPMLGTEAGCPTPFVVFFAVSSVTPKDFKFPQTQSILKDFGAKAKIKALDFSHKSQRYVGARANDTKTAEALVGHWNERDKKSPARPVCFEAPVGARELSF